MGMVEAARAAWLLRFFGASNVRILNGGFHKWLKEGRAPPSQGVYLPGLGLPKRDETEEKNDFSIKDTEKVVKDVN